MVRKMTEGEALAFLECGSIPSDAVPFYASNAALIETTSAITIKAAPGAGKSIYITQAVFSNITVTELAALVLQDEDNVEICHVTLSILSAQTKTVRFNPPAMVAANKIVEGIAVNANGDSTISINGFIGTTLASLEGGKTR